MQIIPHTKNNIQIAEVLSDDILIKTAEAGAKFLADLYYTGFDLVIIRSSQLAREFFIPGSGLADQVFKQCSGLRIKLSIIGNSSDVPASSLRHLIYENKDIKVVNFVTSLNSAIDCA